MSTAIGSITSLPGVAPSTGGSTPAVASGGFGEALARMVESSEAAAGDANNKVASMLDGSGDVHDAMIALQRAEIALQLTVQVRNKLVQAYQDVMRMPV